MRQRTFVHTRMLFAVIYFIEGFITAMFALSFLYLTGIGIDPASLSVVIVIALAPLFFKPFAGIVSDKFTVSKYGRRKPWLLIGIGIQAMSFFGLSLVDPTETLTLYMLVMCFAVAALVIYDTCADGLALDLLTPDEYGKIQFWMTAGRYSAVLVIPPIVTGLADSVGWPIALATLGVLSLIPVPIVLTLKEPQRTKKRQFTLGSIRKPLVPPGIFICLLGFATMLSTSGTEEIWLGYLRNDVGVPLGIVGWFSTIFGVGVIIGAFIGAKIYSAIGRIASNYVTIALIILSALILAVASETLSAIAASIAFGLTMGILHVTVFSLGMTLRVVGAEATTFAIFSVFLVTGTVIGMTISPWLVSQLSYSWTFVANGFMALIGVLMLWLLKNREAQMDSPRKGY